MPAKTQTSSQIQKLQTLEKDNEKLRMDIKLTQMHIDLTAKNIQIFEEFLHSLKNG
ncbi:hypothetical protein HZA38_00635 [Candidatus Peregrinibacteria bacterium]|nr:hypothetical protein [Candidatus Peregrinibacteria bacterium]